MIFLRRSLSFILAYFPTGTMERVDMEGQVATASTMARLLSATPLTAMGPTKLLIFDIHALQVWQYRSLFIVISIVYILQVFIFFISFPSHLS